MAAAVILLSAVGLAASLADTGGLLRAQDGESEESSTESEIVLATEDGRIEVTVAAPRTYIAGNPVQVTVTLTDPQTPASDLSDLTLTLTGPAGRMSGTAFAIDDVSGQATLGLDAVDWQDEVPTLNIAPDEVSQEPVSVGARLVGPDVDVVDEVSVLPLVTLTRSEPVLTATQAGRRVRYTMTVSANGAVQDVTVIETRFIDSEDAPPGSVLEATTNADRLEENDVVWEFDGLESGDSMILEYDVNFPFAANLGDAEISHLAVAYIGDVFLAQAESFEVVSGPLLVVTPDPASGTGTNGAVVAGDRVTVGLTVENAGSVAANGLRIEVSGADNTLAVVQPESRRPQTDVDSSGSVWADVRLEPGQSQRFEFVEVVGSEVASGTTVKHPYTVSYGGDPVVSNSTSYNVEAGGSSTSPRGVDGAQLFVLVLIYILIAFFAFFLILILRRSRSLRGSRSLEIFTVVNLLAALLILALGSELPEEGALSLLAAIAGYVLGRSAGGSDRDDRPDTPEPTDPQATDGGTDGPDAELADAGGAAAGTALATGRGTAAATSLGRIADATWVGDRRPSLRATLGVMALAFVLVVVSAIGLLDVSTGSDVSPWTYAASAAIAVLIVTLIATMLLTLTHGQSDPRREPPEPDPRTEADVQPDPGDDQAST